MFSAGVFVGYYCRVMSSYCSKSGVLHLPGEKSCGGKTARHSLLHSANTRTTRSVTTVARMASKSGNKIMSQR